MSGDPTNARIWDGADVLVSFDLDADLPDSIDDPFGPEWNAIGLLNGEDGFVEARDEDLNDGFAWGGVLVRTSRRGFKLTRSFTARETNDVTDRLRWPGSSPTQLVVPQRHIERVKVAFETRDGGTVKRLICRRYAEIVPDGDLTENEQDIADTAFLATIYPDTDGVLFDRQPGAVLAAPLTDAVLLLRAASFTGEPGDDWLNEGTGGSALDATADGTPVIVNDPDRGFVVGDDSSGTPGFGPYYYVPEGDPDLLSPGTGPFTAFAHTTIDAPSDDAFQNVMVKIIGDIGGGGSGWAIFDDFGPFNATIGYLADEGSEPFVNPALALTDDGLTAGDHLCVLRLDRDTDTLDLFVDGVLAATADASAVPDVQAAHELIFGRSYPQISRDYGYWNRALTGTEITVGLPAALGV